MSMKDLLNKMTELTGTQASAEVVSTGKKVLTENTGATDYEGKKGVNRTEALKKYANSKDPKDAEAARKAGATQTELKQAKDEVKESKPSFKGIFNEMLSEAEQVTIQPAKQNTQVIKQGQKTLGTVENPQLAQQIKQSIGKGEMTLAGDELEEGDVIPFRRPANKSQTPAADWHQVPKHILDLANEWYWMDFATGSYDAVTDPNKSDEKTLQYQTALLKQKGWSIDIDDNYENIVLISKDGKRILLPIEDAQDSTGWASEVGALNEKWGTETKVAPSEKGKYEGKTKAELLKQYNALKAKGPHKKGSPDYGKMRELAFAIRAKSDWGKVDETDMGQADARKSAPSSKEEQEKVFSRTREKSRNLRAELDADPELLTKKVSESVINEKAVSKSQQQAAGAALAAKRGDAPKSKLKGASKEMAKMSTKELEKFAGTKHKGLPDKKEKTDEAALPTHDGDFGAGLGAGRNSKTLESKKAKPDYIDLDKDGNKKESMKKAAADKQKVSTMKKTNEAKAKHKGLPDKKEKTNEGIMNLFKKKSPVKWLSDTEADVIFNGKKYGVEVSGEGEDDIWVSDLSNGTSVPDQVRKEVYKLLKANPKTTANEAALPTHDGDFGAGLGAGRNSKTLESKKAKPDYIDLDKDGNKTEPMKKAAADKKKKAVKEGANPTEAARLLGKAHAMGKDPFACKYEEGSPEAQAYLDGYKEGLDECYGSGGGMGMQQSIGMMPGMDSMVSMTDTQSPRGGSDFEVDSFSDFNSQPDEADMMAFEAWDRELNELLNEGKMKDIDIDMKEMSDAQFKKAHGKTKAQMTKDLSGSTDKNKKTVSEGISVSVSKGNQGAPDSVTVSAQDSEADALLAMIKQAGLGLFGGDDQTSSYGAPVSQDQVTAPQGGDVGDHDSMMSLIKKMSSGSNDYEDEESHDDSTCPGCGSSDCGCDDESDSKALVVGEDENEDQMEFEVAEANAPDSDQAETTADEDAEAEEDKALAQAAQQNKTDTFNEGGDGGEASEEDEELTEWANDAGYTGSENTKDNTFEEDIDFMTRVISGGLNGPKKDQTTLPHTRVKVDESIQALNEWKKLSGI